MDLAMHMSINMEERVKYKYMLIVESGLNNYRSDLIMSTRKLSEDEFAKYLSSVISLCKEKSFAMAKQMANSVGTNGVCRVKWLYVEMLNQGQYVHSIISDRSSGYYKNLNQQDFRIRAKWPFASVKVEERGAISLGFVSDEVNFHTTVEPSRIKQISREAFEIQTDAGKIKLVCQKKEVTG